MKSLTFLIGILIVVSQPIFAQSLSLATYFPAVPEVRMMVDSNANGLNQKNLLPTAVAFNKKVKLSNGKNNQKNVVRLEIEETRQESNFEKIWANAEAPVFTASAATTPNKLIIDVPKKEIIVYDPRTNARSNQNG